MLHSTWAPGRPMRWMVAVAVVGPWALLSVPTSGIGAQEVRIIGPSMVRSGVPEDRAVLGIVMAPASAKDTAGVTVESVDANGPAARAGLKAGDVLLEINGTSLRLAREDAEDRLVVDVAQRRLQRALAKAKPGEAVTLRVRTAAAAPRTVSVQTVSRAELDRAERAERVERVVEGRVLRENGREEMRERRDDAAPRGVVGLTIGGVGNARDTLGLFVSSVVSGGPAERAGIIEGERVAAVNGVDVRVPREDVEEPAMITARVERFQREVGKVAPGTSLTLRVFGNGRYRDVAVTPVAPRDLPRRGMTVFIGDGGAQVTAPRAPRPPMPPSAPGAVRRQGQVFEWDGSRPRVFEFDFDDEIGRLRLNAQELRIDREQLRRSLEEMRRGLEEGLRGVQWRTLPSTGRRA